MVTHGMTYMLRTQISGHSQIDRERTSRNEILSVNYGLTERNFYNYIVVVDKCTGDLVIRNGGR